MKDYTFKELRESYTFLAPLIIIILVLILLPVIGTFITSLFKDVSFLEKKYIGLENYKNLLGDGRFWQSFKFTLLFTFVSVGLEMVLGLFTSARLVIS